MTTAEQLLAQARDAFTVNRVFGEPMVVNGLTLIPVAALRGGGGTGGGGGVSEDSSRTGSGWGGGFGGTAKGLGMYVVRDQEVRFVPVVDVGRAMLVGAIVVLAGLWLIARPHRRQSGER